MPAPTDAERARPGRVRGLVELHAHTTCSDGLLSPVELVEAARDRGLVALAVTDHDTTAAIAAAARRGAEVGVRVIPGVEVTCGVGEEEVHVLGYGVSPDDDALCEALAEITRRRHARLGVMVERLAALGLRIAMDEAPNVPTRLHVARELVRAGHVASVRRAFERHLGIGRPAYVPKELVPAARAIALLHAAGGVAVLAHPGRYPAPPPLEALAEDGLDGIEAYYPGHTSEQVADYERFADGRGLLLTGGSDFHGFDSRCALGRQRVPPAVIEELDRAVARRRQEVGARPRLPRAGA